MSHHKNHYVYGLFREDVVFYIGRGTGDRMYHHFGKELCRDTNGHKNAVIRKCRRNGTKCEARKLFSSLTKTEAVRTEQVLLNCLFELLTNKSRNTRKNNASLTEQSVREINWLLKNSNETQKEIADRYNCASSTVSDIKNEYNWQHVNEYVKPD